MIDLYQFPAMYGLPNVSPFCMKLESYLKAQSLTYQKHGTIDMRKSPTSKMPYVYYNNRYYSDSGFIITMLEKDSHTPMQKALSDIQKAQTQAFGRLCEEHLYWALVYSRWVDNNTGNTWKKDLSSQSNMPGFLFKMILKVMTKNVIKQLDGHGIGRHTSVQIYQLADQDLKALSDALGDQDYFFNNEPTLLDHTVYAFTASIFYTPWQNPLKQNAQGYPNLYAHCQRMLARFFKEYL
ncbi:glutathione S-transferase family protein [Facilibium subflavum]|uniref:glutathione S-transferase family protein n=1 Tax=Facilibium subflavum TaxID=2219058 RepID=UPI000E656C63|nr:glutathione S-transferase family protein [Facilibium subflavum]